MNDTPFLLVPVNTHSFPLPIFNIDCGCSTYSSFWLYSCGFWKLLGINVFSYVSCCTKFAYVPKSLFTFISFSNGDGILYGLNPPSFSCCFISSGCVCDWIPTGFDMFPKMSLIFVGCCTSFSNGDLVFWIWYKSSWLLYAFCSVLYVFVSNGLFTAFSSTWFMFVEIGAISSPKKESTDVSYDGTFCSWFILISAWLSLNTDVSNIFFVSSSFWLYSGCSATSPKILGNS